MVARARCRALFTEISVVSSIRAAWAAGVAEHVAQDQDGALPRRQALQPGHEGLDMNPENGPASDFLRSVTALGHYGRAEDIAALVAYLASEGGRYLTGTAITIDGGLAA